MAAPKTIRVSRDSPFASAKAAASLLPADGGSLCSEPLHLYPFDVSRQRDFLMFSFNLAEEIDQSLGFLKYYTDRSPIHNKDLTSDEVLDIHEVLKEYNELPNKGNGDRVAYYGRHIDDLCRNIFVSGMDSFMWYLSHIVQLVMRQYPSILKSSETIKFEEIVDLPDRSALINYIVDKKVTELSFGGLRDILKYLSDRMNIETPVEADGFNAMNALVELRNIAVHNRGYVNRLFLSRVKENPLFEADAGDRVFFDPSALDVMTNVCVPLATQLDRQICSKYRLRRRRWSTWQRELEKLRLRGVSRL